MHGFESSAAGMLRQLHVTVKRNGNAQMSWYTGRIIYPPCGLTKTKPLSVPSTVELALGPHHLILLVQEKPFAGTFPPYSGHDKVGLPDPA